MDSLENEREQKLNGEFYQTHLDRVSRSFAFCIRQLPEPLHDWVGLSYLLCRLVDTIEDSAWVDAKSQMVAFQIFDDSLKNPVQINALLGWQKQFPSDLPSGEQLLLEDAFRLISDFHDLPKDVREMMRDLVLSMSAGMQHFCVQREQGQLRLRTLAEVNQYCFFVAGIVGELLANLLARVEPQFWLSQGILMRAHHFGLFLQKVNLLKDQVADEQVGRHLIPSRQLVEDSAYQNAQNALQFLLELPKSQIEFRRFCAWSLFLGLEALVVARQSLRSQRVLKVSRTEMQSIFDRVEPALDDDLQLRALFEAFVGKLGWNQLGAMVQEVYIVPEWLPRLYNGPLDRQSLSELGLALPR